jgi:hypothetical protein
MAMDDLVWSKAVNKLLSRFSDLVVGIGKSWAKETQPIDFKEIDRMRNKLTKMRFSKPSMEIEVPLQATTEAGENYSRGSLRNNFNNLSLRERDRQSIRKWFVGSEPIDIEKQLKETIRDMADSRRKQLDDAQDQWQFAGIHDEYPRIGCNPVDPVAEEAVAKFLSSGSASPDITPVDRRIGVNYGCGELDANGDCRQLPAVIESLEQAINTNATDYPTDTVDEQVCTVIEDQSEDTTQQVTLADSMSNKVVPLRTSLKSANRWRQKK